MVYSIWSIEGNLFLMYLLQFIISIVLSSDKSMIGSKWESNK